MVQMASVPLSLCVFTLRTQRLRDTEGFPEGPHLDTLQFTFTPRKNWSVSKMSQRETTDVSEHLEVGQSPKDNLPKLLEAARQAYERKHTKDCLDLTRAILLIDPENAVANWMRSSLQSEMHRDLENARAFMRQAQSKEYLETASQPAPEMETSAERPEQPLQEIIQAVAAAAPVPAETNPRGRWVALTILVLVVGVGLAVAALPRFRATPRPVQAPVSKPIQEAKTPEPVPLPPEHSVEVPGVAAATQTPVPVSAPAPALIGQRPAKVSDPRVVPTASGTLAVSSATTVDIYENDTYIGSAPVSLELSGGTHTLEYRHGNLRKRVTHVINGDETSRAMITFDVSVQINSKPWAEVFLDGAERKSLGQTPLSGVRVPIGSVLVFENPQFQTKKYRVTGNETGIQIVFP
jgi:hypothetical protein